MKDLWVEKYRPKTVDEYVFRDDNQQKQIEGWISDGALPHLLFSGAPGTGKTTLAVSYTHLTLPTIWRVCRSRWSQYH